MRRIQRRAGLAAAALAAAVLLDDPVHAQRLPRGPRGPREGRGSALAVDLPTLQPAIDDAIDRGVEFLLSRQLRDGTWGDHSISYGSGQTGLALYTLLKSGLGSDHPAVARGFAALEEVQPTKVYEASCLLLAYQAHNAPGDRERMKGILDKLLGWQEGSFSYPYGGDNTWHGSRPDLSNTQFAALGLRAARQAELGIPPRAWQRLLEATLDYQEEPRLEEEVPATPDATRGTVEVAGFRYRPPVTVSPPPIGRSGGRPGLWPGRGRRAQGEQRGATGSMTAAGIAVLEICREGLGRRVAGADGLAVDRAQASALRWLAEEFSADHNPGEGAWLNYYLYGIERVGALLEIDRIGDHDWYLEGARRLVLSQLPSGAWAETSPEADTCFALLFLQRATAPVSGIRPSARRVHTSEGEVHLRGTGSGPVVVWIAGFDEGVLREHGFGRDGPRVLEVVYLVDGEPVGRVAGDPTRGWKGEQLPQRIGFDRTGLHEIDARVHAVPPDAPEDSRAATLLLRTDGFAVRVESVSSDWGLAAARRSGRNLLRESDLEVSVSSTSPDGPARDAVDGLEATSWVASPDDLQPTISLRLSRSVRADLITLGGADARAADQGRHDQIVRARVTIDGEAPAFVRFDPDGLRPAVVRLPRARSIRSLEVRILERVPGSGRSGTVGLAEIGLYRER